MGALRRALASRAQPRVESDSLAELETLRREIAERDRALADLKRQTEEATRRAEQSRVTAEREQVRSRVIQAAHKSGAIDPEEVADLLTGRLRLEGNRVVSAETPEQDHEAVVKSYLAGKPHHVRAPVAQGSGAPPYPGSAPTPPPPQQFDLSTREGATGALRAGLLGSIKPKQTQI